MPRLNSKQAVEIQSQRRATTDTPIDFAIGAVQQLSTSTIEQAIQRLEAEAIHSQRRITILRALKEFIAKVADNS